MIYNDWNKLASKLTKLKNQNKKIAFTNGCFDIIHPGHVSYLKQSKELADVLVVALNTDESVSKLKGPLRPINSENDRAIVMDSLKPVDFVAFFGEDTPYDIIKTLQPHIITKGGDYNPNDVVGKDIVESNGGEVVIIPFVEGKSTSSIIEKMNS